MRIPGYQRLLQPHGVSLTGIVLLLGYVIFAYRHFPFLDNRLNRLAIGLILGGAAGNFIDRLYFGFVTDFINIGFWPVFNIADSAVTVGVILFICSLLPLVSSGKI